LTIALALNIIMLPVSYTWWDNGHLIIARIAYDELEQNLIEKAD